MILTTFLNDAEEGSLEEGGAETVSVGLGGLFIESNATQLPLHASLHTKTSATKKDNNNLAFCIVSLQ